MKSLFTFLLLAVSLTATLQIVDSSVQKTCKPLNQVLQDSVKKQGGCPPICQQDPEDCSVSCVSGCPPEVIPDEGTVDSEDAPDFEAVPLTK